MPKMYLWVLSLFLVLTVTESKDCPAATETVSGSSEDNIFLPCLNLESMQSNNSYRVRWTKHVADGRQAKVLFAKPAPAQFKHSQRMKWEADGRGQMSLLLTNLQTSDAGLYICEVWKDWDCIVRKNISLRVKDCKTLVVKVAPGTAINLSCPMDAQLGPQNPQNVSWSFLKGGNPVIFSSDTLFNIKSVGIDDYGWYRCRYTLRQTQRCIDINLVQATTLPTSSTSTEQGLSFSVSTTRTTIWETMDMEEKKAERKGEQIAVCVVLPIIALIIVATMTGLCIYYRFKTRRIGQEVQRTGDRIQSMHSYEMVGIGLSDEYTKPKICSLYEPCQEESMHTFTY